MRLYEACARQSLSKAFNPNTYVELISLVRLAQRLLPVIGSSRKKRLKGRRRREIAIVSLFLILSFSSTHTDGNRDCLAPFDRASEMGFRSVSESTERRRQEPMTASVSSGNYWKTTALSLVFRRRRDLDAKRSRRGECDCSKREQSVFRSRWSFARTCSPSVSSCFSCKRTRERFRKNGSLKSTGTARDPVRLVASCENVSFFLFFFLPSYLAFFRNFYRL